MHRDHYTQAVTIAAGAADIARQWGDVTLDTLEARAHLELLVARGTPTRGHADGVVLYSA